MINIAICDDDREFLERVEVYVSDLCENLWPDQDIRLYHYDNPEIMLKEAELQAFSLALLDIQMPIMNGITAARKLKDIRPSCSVIFLTAYLNYAQQVYDVDHIALVLKADMKQFLPKAFQRFFGNYKEGMDKSIVVESGGVTHFIKQKDICMMSHHDRSTDIFTVNSPDPITVSCRIEDLYKKLDQQLFCQTHKSFVISWMYVDRIEKNNIRLHNQKDEVPISRNYKPIVKERISEFLENGLFFEQMK